MCLHLQDQPKTLWKKIFFFIIFWKVYNESGEVKKFWTSLLFMANYPSEKSADHRTNRVNENFYIPASFTLTILVSGSRNIWLVHSLIQKMELIFKVFLERVRLVFQTTEFSSCFITCQSGGKPLNSFKYSTEEALKRKQNTTLFKFIKMDSKH